jgi:hypothetical protein
MAANTPGDSLGQGHCSQLLICGIESGNEPVRHNSEISAAWPRASSLIEKETSARQMSNVDGRMSN